MGTWMKKKTQFSSLVKGGVSHFGERELIFEAKSQTNTSPYSSPSEAPPLKLAKVHCQGNDSNN